MTEKEKVSDTLHKVFAEPRDISKEQSNCGKINALLGKDKYISYIDTHHNGVLVFVKN